MRALPVHVCALIAWSAALFLVGCAGERPVEEAAREGILLIGNGPEPQGLDPHVTTGTSALSLQLALYEGLVSPDPSTLEPLPAVAEEWAMSDDGLIFEFRLRGEARWSDGRGVTAGDFAAAWRRALDPEGGVPYAYMLYPLRGAEDYHRGELKDFSSVGVHVLADDLLKVELKHPVPHFLSLLMHPVWFPIPGHVAGASTSESRHGSWTRPGNFVGNGPFLLVDWQPNEVLTARRNPHYWDVHNVALEGIHFFPFDEPSAEERAFLAGQLHVTDSLPPARVAAWKQRNAPELRIDPYLGTYYLLPNVREGVLADPRVRRALALAIDREAITTHLLGAGQEPAAGFVPTTMPGYESPAQLIHDPEAARHLLAEAGYPGGRGFPELEYLFNTSESHRKIAEALQGMWREELGVDVTLVNQEWRTYLQRRASGDFELARAVWIGDYVEPSTFLDLWRSDSGNNWAGWAHPAYDAFMEMAARSANPVARMEAYQQAEALLLEEQAIIPLYHYVTVYLKDPRVKGWSSNLLDWHPYKYLSLAK